jgi:glycine C-acetyltransferase/8-amino-7-oxononanoate synthase
VVIGTLGKALGSYGAFACCDRRMREFLINRARTVIYSTAPPPPSIGAALAALRSLREQPSLVERLWSNARALRTELGRQGFAVDAGEMPIVPVIVGEARDAMELCERALVAGVFAQAIRPPTVPAGTSRLRLVARANQDEADLIAAARALAQVR